MIITDIEGGVRTSVLEKQYFFLFA